MSPNHDIPRTLIHIPERGSRGVLGSLIHAVKGVTLGPPYWLAAATVGAPGMRFRGWCSGLGMRALISRKISMSATFHLLFMPMESTRYFELEFARKMLLGLPMHRYLDVSSPRLMPIHVLDNRQEVVADVLNPDPRDLEETARFVDLVNATGRCNLHNCLITEAAFEPQTFDVVTSISVLEHIPDDRAAVAKIWELLKPGGAFVLTVPCTARASEQYIDRYGWDVLEKNRDGYVFWQRLYDRRLLAANVFAITGEPRSTSIFGEKLAGSLARNSHRKRSDSTYPYWREPYMMGTEYGYFDDLDDLDDLPGEGVIGMLFVKK
jgi:SAM-dependent methyltransferase